MRLLPKRRWIRVVLSLVILALLIVIVDQVWVWKWRQIEVGRDTTRILAPMEPSGCPDYLAAINAECSAGVTPENNAAPLLLQAVGLEGGQEPWRAAIKTKLGLPSAPLPGRVFTLGQSVSMALASTTTTAKAAAKLSDADEDRYYEEEALARRASWSAVDHAQWVQWVHANEPALELLYAATERSRYYVPIASRAGTLAGLGRETVLGLLIPSTGTYRVLGGSCLARANMRLDAGDQVGFCADVLVTMKLTRLLAQSPTVIEYLPARALDEEAMTAVQAAASSRKLDAPTCKTLREAIAAQGAFPSPARQVDTQERYLCLDCICKLARYDEIGISDPPSPETNSWRTSPVNFNRCLRLTNQLFDEETAAFRMPTFPERRKAFADSVVRSDARYESLGRVEMIVISVSLPSFSRTDNMYTANLSQRNLALTALALREQEIRTAKFPESLEDLGPADRADRVDPFVEQPFIYHRSGDGYVLYSVGPNLKDDGGVPKAKEGPARKDYDLVVKAER